MLQQFFTHAAEVLWPFIEYYDPGFDTIIDPFAGRGHLLELYKDFTERRISVDIDENVEPEWVADSLEDIPNHEMLNLEDVLVLTNPPFMYRAILQKCNPKLYQKVADGRFYDLYELCLARVKGSGDRSFKAVVPMVELTGWQIEELIRRFNAWVESWRAESFGLGLISFRENVGGFRRKRLDFGTAKRALDSIIAEIVESDNKTEN